MNDQCSTITLDPSGDLTIIAKNRDETVTRSFTVSTKALCLASPHWNSMLNPLRPWARQNPDQDTFTLEEDDPDALVIILRIAHLQFEQVPRSIGYSHLLEIAIICDKYDTIKLVGPWYKVYTSLILLSRSNLQIDA